MHRIATTAAVIALSALGAGRANAQHDGHEDPDTTAHPSHGTPFSSGPRENWTFSSPHLDVDGGLFYVRTDPADTREAFVRVHVQTALGIHTLQLSSDVLFIPSFGATPVWSGLLEEAPIPQTSRFYVAAGIGLISGRNASGDRLSGWVQGVFAYRSPVHELTPFVQAGKALSRGNRAELLFGIAHPLAPYKLHLP